MDQAGFAPASASVDRDRRSLCSLHYRPSFQLPILAEDKFGESAIFRFDQRKTILPLRSYIQTFFRAGRRIVGE